MYLHACKLLSILTHFDGSYVFPVTSLVTKSFIFLLSLLVFLFLRRKKWGSSEGSPHHKSEPATALFRFLLITSLIQSKNWDDAIRTHRFPDPKSGALTKFGHIPEIWRAQPLLAVGLPLELHRLNVPDGEPSILDYERPRWDSNPDNPLQRSITVLETGAFTNYATEL